MDPAVESGLDGFSLTFPLPYRVGFIVTLGKRRNSYSTCCILLTCRRCLGLGSESSWAANLQDRRPSADTIPRTSLAAACITPFLDIPSCDRPLSAVWGVYNPVLAVHVAYPVSRVRL